MGLGSIEDGSNATMVLPNAHMGPSGAEALVIPATRSDQCPLTPLHWDHIPTKRKNWGRMCSSFHSQQASGHTMSSPNPAWTPPHTHTHLVTLRRTSRDLTGVANQPSPWDTSRLRLGQKTQRRPNATICLTCLGQSSPG